MTTTNVFSGLTGDKNSSKVLKPPGGGHSDIFGAPEPPVKRDSGRNASSILEGTNNIIPEKQASPVKPTAPPSQQSDNENTASASAPTRNRVPPGGYSSGPLW
ncbi:hypothetical protein ABEB36_007233 [Hypothenemus hampei]|uniref:Microtubule-associated protein Jupiter n=1 Tax=Hypothenemus hampei TaxID=57062 RepID=A0ABD1ETA1_HYPHA